MRIAQEPKRHCDQFVRALALAFPPGPHSASGTALAPRQRSRKPTQRSRSSGDTGAFRALPGERYTRAAADAALRKAATDAKVRHGVVGQPELGRYADCV